MTDPATRRPRFRLPNEPLVLLAGLALVAIYLSSYLGNPAVPGNTGRFPLGWWGWWDQLQYLRSATAFAHGDLLADRHWYPPGYALVAAPFVRLWPHHGFLLLDLACLLSVFAAFLAFARAIGVGRGWAALLFLLGTCGSESLRNVWAEPWNTTLSAALIWWLLALTAYHLTGPGPTDQTSTGTPLAVRRRRLGFLLAGAIVATIPFTRPTDLLLVAVWAAGSLLAALRLRRLSIVDLLSMGCGAALLLALEAGLWIGIYGWHPSPYMISSRSMGFDVGVLGWKTYLLLDTPRPWFTAGFGIVQRLPWVLPGLAGLLALPWLTRDAARLVLCVLAAMIVAYAALFFSYVDLIPSGLWRYNNIHYFKWLLPGVALFGFLLLRALVRGPRRPALLASIAVLLLADLRLDPRRVGATDPAWMVQVPGPVPGWDDAYFGPVTLRDDRGVLQPIRDFRAIPDSQGWRLIALRRPFAGGLVIGGLGHWPDGPVGNDTRRWTWSPAFRLPCMIAACTPALD